MSREAAIILLNLSQCDSPPSQVTRSQRHSIYAPRRDCRGMRTFLVHENETGGQHTTNRKFLNFV